MKTICLILFQCCITLYAWTQNFNYVDSTTIDPLLKGLANAEKIIEPYLMNNDTSNVDFHFAEFIFSLVLTRFKDPTIYYQRGICNYMLGNHNQAVFDFTECLNSVNNHYNAFVRTMTTYQKIEEGYYENDTIVILYYRPFSAFYFRGICKQELADYRGAITDYNKSVKYYKRPSFLYFRIAQCYFELEQYTNSKNNLLTAIKLDNKNANLYGLLGACNYNLGLKETACKNWSKAGELGSSIAYDQIKEFCH